MSNMKDNSGGSLMLSCNRFLTVGESNQNIFTKFGSLKTTNRVAKTRNRNVLQHEYKKHPCKSRNTTIFVSR